MAKFFGEYLIEKKLINEGQLLQMLVEQHREVPSVLELVLKYNILNHKEILETLKHQVLQKMEFVTAAKELNYWDDEKAETLENLIKSERSPLGEILVHQGIIEQNQLIDVLDEYLNDHSHSLSMTQKDLPIVKKESVQKAKDFHSIQWNQINTEGRNLIQNYFSLKRKKGLSSAIVAKDKDFLAFQFRALRGLAQYLGLSLMEAISERGETLIQNVLHGEIQQESVEFSLMEVNDLLWELSESLKVQDTEEYFWKNHEFLKEWVSTGSKK